MMSQQKDVPRGNYFWVNDREKVVNVAAIVDEKGEIFLMDEDSNSLYWGYETLWPSYSLYVARGVDDYLDFHAGEKLLFRHNGDLQPMVVTLNYKEPDVEKRRRDIEHKLNSFYKKGKVFVEFGRSKSEIDYNTGREATNSTKHNCWVTINRYRIRNFSKDAPTLRWELEFCIYEVSFSLSTCPCLVHHTRNSGEFIELCRSLKISKLPDGRVLEDLIWMDKYKTDRITLDDVLSPWVNDEKAGMYEDTKAVVRRIQKRGHTLQPLIRKLKALSSVASMIQFFGWKETSNHYLVAFEKYPLDLASYAKQNAKEDKLDSGIVRDLVVQIYLLRRAKKVHGNLTPENIYLSSNNVVKLGLPSLDVGQSDLPCLGKVLFLLSNPGFEIDHQRGLTSTELDTCTHRELRYLIEELSSSSPPKGISICLALPFFWDSHTAIRFISTISDVVKGCSLARSKINARIKKDNVFKGHWFKKGDPALLDESYVNERAGYRSYNYTDGCDLVKILRNGFAHFLEMDDTVRKNVGGTTEGMVLYVSHTFPNLFVALHAAGKDIVKWQGVVNEKARTHLLVFYE